MAIAVALETIVGTTEENPPSNNIGRLIITAEALAADAINDGNISDNEEPPAVGDDDDDTATDAAGPAGSEPVALSRDAYPHDAHSSRSPFLGVRFSPMYSIVLRTFSCIALIPDKHHLPTFDISTRLDQGDDLYTIHTAVLILLFMAYYDVHIGRLHICNNDVSQQFSSVILASSSGSSLIRPHIYLRAPLTCV